MIDQLNIHYHAMSSEDFNAQIVAVQGHDGMDAYYRLNLGCITIYLTEKQRVELLNALISAAPLPKSGTEQHQKTDESVATMAKCEYCHGTGIVKWHLGDEFNSQGEGQCSTCQGTGLVESNEDRVATTSISGGPEDAPF
jgi:hypothetical protein